MYIPYGRQNVSEDDIEAVTQVLRSDYLTQGPIVPRFEASVAAYVSSEYAVAVNSGTSALHLACMALNVSSGDYVWTSPITFVASANCALYCGATIDFVDIDPISYNMSISALSLKLERAKKSNTLPKVVIPVHLAGQSCEMLEIHKLSKQYGFKIIEDASHAIGSTYLNKPVGSCLYSDISVFSFHPVKIVTSVEGGMAVTNNIELAELMQRLRSHGITRDQSSMKGSSDGSWYYQQLELGFNYRMSDIHAALGLNQMKRLDEFVEKRNTLALYYDSLLKDLPVKIPVQNKDCYSSFHLYIIRIPQKSSSSDRLHVFDRLRSSGIGVNVHYIPVYRQPFFQKFNFKYEDFPESENYYAEAISLPLFPNLSKEQQEKIVKIVSSPVGHQSLF
jgi:UDP-4-amino-4,6-dideoxy-N-acetyl-beta-L-altrosamine transaminase